MRSDSEETHPDAKARSAAGRNAGALRAALALTGGFMLVEAAVGVWTRSLALLADAAHMLTDVAGLALALVAIRWAAKPPTPRKTYGYYRVEIFAAAINATLLLGVSAFIVYEAYRRLLSPPDVIGGPMLAVATVGLAVNAVSMWLLRRGSGESLNVKGAYLEVMSDAVGSLGVIVAGVIVLTTGWMRADPLIAAGIGLFIVPRTWRLLSEAVNVLLEGVPPHVDVGEVERAMRAEPGVQQVHDLHVWTLTSGREAMSGHVIVAPGVDGTALVQRLHDVLHQRFGIEHTTVQIEHAPVVQVTTTPRPAR